MVLVRTALGAQLRRHRLAQRRTLRDVSGRARVSLGYLSEIERGHKEASSELLASICDALDVELSSILRDTSDDLALAELVTATRDGAAATVTSRSRLSVAAEGSGRPVGVSLPDAGEVVSRVGVAVNRAA
ncbi:MAG TPA: helix-turn-helix transcriptional regulator [Mycobacteriales bacterium]|jgi:transcriptional regulator with XRE-family HTH domain|nr:helix-turn-helix transcriptional regulator [Mycobacteriales bacterium]